MGSAANEPHAMLKSQFCDALPVHHKQLPHLGGQVQLALYGEGQKVPFASLVAPTNKAVGLTPKQLSDKSVKMDILMRLALRATTASVMSTICC